MKDILHAICRREGLAARQVQALSGGQVNAVYRVDGQYVIRIGKRADALQRLSREAELLRSLEGEIPVPKIYATGQIEGQVYQVQAHLPGEKLYTLWVRLSSEVQEAIVSQLAGYLRILHARQLPHFGKPGEGPAYTSWPRFVADKFQSTLDEIRSLGIRMAPGYVEMAQEYFAAHQEALEEGAPTLVHCDLTLVNVLAQDSKITALLDFEHALCAPRDYELLALEGFCLYPNDWAEEENEVFCCADYAAIFPLLQKHYPEMFATPRLRERVNLYQLAAALSSYLAWRKDNLDRIPPGQMNAKEFYMARITNFVFEHGVRLFY